MRTGWIGVGNMGLPMATNVMRAGYEVVAFDIASKSLLQIEKKGAERGRSVGEVSSGAEIVFSSIPDDAALRQIALSADGVLAAAGEGTIYVEMSTVSPEVSREVAAAARERGIHYLRSPVSGSVRLAEAAALTVIVSGSDDAVNTCRPLLESIGSKVYHVGSGEEARYLKLAINNMVYATAVAMAESLALCRKGGLDWSQTLDVFADSAVASPLVKYKADPIRHRDFVPTSFVSTTIKDQDLFVDSARATGVSLDIAPVVASVFHDMLNSEDADRDFFATILRTERASGLGDL